MLADLAVVVVGIGLVVVLARVVIDRSIVLSDHFGLSGGLVGLTFLAVGTSLPEIATHVTGSLRILARPGDTDTISGLVVGTNVGSDIFQQTALVAAVAAAGSLTVRGRDLATELGPLIAATVAVWVLSLGGFLSRTEGVALVAAYGAYLWWLRGRHVGEPHPASHHLGRSDLTRTIATIGASLVLVVALADRVLVAAADTVEASGISASLFGVLVIGIATSLPELATAAIAMRKGHADISAGILLGSNVTNPLLGLGLGAAISGYTIPTVIVAYDLPVKAATGALLAWLFWSRQRLGRREAVLLAVLFCAYAVARPALFPTDVV